MAGLLLSASVTLNLFGESRPKYGKPYYPLEDTCAQSIANNQSFIATRICTSLFSLSKTTKAPHPLEKKKRKSVLVSRVFQQFQNQVVIADGCCMRKCCLGVHWPGLGNSHVQTLTRTVQHVNSKSKLFGSVTCMFFALYMHINWYGDSVLWLEFQSWSSAMLIHMWLEEIYTPKSHWTNVNVRTVEETKKQNINCRSVDLKHEKQLFVLIVLWTNEMTRSNLLPQSNHLYTQ